MVLRVPQYLLLSRSVYQRLYDSITTCSLWVGLAKLPDVPLQRSEAPGVSLLLSTEVDDAEGRDRVQIDDEATREKWTKGMEIRQRHDENCE